MNGLLKKGLLGGVCLALAMLCALPAHAATSVYPNGARGGNNNMDNDDGFYSTTRKLDFDLLAKLFDNYILTLVPTWVTGNIYATVDATQTSSMYGADNNGNGIPDTDQYDALAALVNGGTTAAPGLTTPVTTYTTNFNNNRTKVQQRELTIPAVSVNYGGIGITSTITTGTTLSILFGAFTVDIPSLWSIKEDFANGASGVLADAGDMFEVCMRDILAAEMTLAPASSTELTHVQSFINVFIRQFIKTALPAILQEAGNVTADNSDWNASPAPIVNVTLQDGSTVIKVQITSTNMNTAINNFKNSFSCTNFTCSPTGNGSLVPAGNLNSAGNTNLASWTAAAGNRQTFMSNEGITKPPIQIKVLQSNFTGVEGFSSTLGPGTVYQVLGGDGSALAYDWETVNNPELTWTNPQLTGTTSNSTYVYSNTPASAQGVYHSVQIADNTYTKTLPPLPLVLSGLPPAPTVSSIQVMSGTTIKLTYSSAVTTNSTTNSSYALTGTGKGTLNTNPDLVTNLGSNQYLLTWNSGEMTNGGNLTVTVSGVTDSSGQPVGSPTSGSCTGCATGTAPTISSIVSQNPGLTNASSIDYLVTFSESVQGVAGSNFFLTTTNTASGTISAPTGTGSARTVSITGITGTGTIRLDLNSPSGISDLAGNALVTTLNGGVSSVDREPPATPTVDLAAASDSGESNTDNITNATTPTIQGTTSGGVTVQLFTDNPVPNTAIGTTTSVSGGGYTTTTSTLGNGVHNITAVATDAAGNSATSSALQITVDTVRPAAPSAPDLVAASDSGISSTDNITNLTSLTFNGTREANSSVAVAPGSTGTFTSATPATGAGTSWSLSGTGVASQSLRVRATDIAGNTSLSDSPALALTVDTTSPSISIRNPAAGLTVASLTQVQLTFNETVSGLAASNLIIDGNAATGLGGSGAGPYTFTFPDPAVSGTVNVALLAGSATDVAGNALTPSNWTYDENNTNPSISFTGTNITDGGITNGTPGPLQVTITFTEDVSGFAVGDITRSNCNLSSFTTINAKTYRVTVSPTTNGTISLSVAANVATATAAPAGRGNAASGTFSFTYDNIRPNVSFALINNNEITNDDVITGTITFDGPVTDFDDQADLNIIVTGSVAFTDVEIIPVSTSIYNFEINGVTGDGTLQVNIPTGAARDAANNPNNAGPGLPPSVTIDNIAPVLTVNPLSTTDRTPPLGGTVGASGVDADGLVTITVNGQSNTVAATGNDWSLPDNTLVSLNDGIYDVEAVAFDIAGNLGSDATTNELKVDSQPPVLTLSALYVPVDCGAGFTEATDGGFTAIDTIDGDLTANVIVTGSVTPTSPVGQYTINYSVTDSSGHTATAQRTVEVLDNCPLDVFAVGATSFLREGGESVTMEVGVSGAIGAYSIQWYRVAGSKADIPVGDDDETLELTNLTAVNDADYYALVTDAVTDDFSPIFHVDVNVTVPAMGAIGLGLSAALSALGGALSLRRRKK